PISTTSTVSPRCPSRPMRASAASSAAFVERPRTRAASRVVSSASQVIRLAGTPHPRAASTSPAPAVANEALYEGSPPSPVTTRRCRPCAATGGAIASAAATSRRTISGESLHPAIEPVGAEQQQEEEEHQRGVPEIGGGACGDAAGGERGLVR